MSRTEKKSFFDLYAEQKKKPTPAQNFIAEIAALTHRSENTVKMWLCGRQVPDELTQSIIARRYNLNINGLFPWWQQTQIRGFWVAIIIILVLLRKKIFPLIRRFI